jgi:hypothetical protein
MDGNWGCGGCKTYACLFMCVFVFVVSATVLRHCLIFILYQNATKDEIKQAKATFWNNTMTGFGGVLNQPAWLQDDEDNDGD